MTHTRLIWHRRDLRLHDNALYQDNNDETLFLSLFVFDPALIQARPSTVHKEEWKTVWTGPHALSSLLHALHALRYSLRERSSDLWIRWGDPAVCIPALARQVKATQVAWHVEPGWYEEQLSRRVQEALELEGIQCIRYTGCTLMHPDDLPQTPHEWKMSQSINYHQQSKKDGINARQPQDCPKSKCPSSQWMAAPRIMGNFRTACRNFASVRRCWSTPTRIRPPQTVERPGEIPTLAQLLQPMLQLEDRSILGLRKQQIQQICDAALAQHEKEKNCQRGCEPWALDRLDSFLIHHAATADRSRADVEINHSSKLSLPLALGTISPRVIYEKALMYNNCTWLISHLEMRDFFLFTVMNAGSRVYQPDGLPVRTDSSGEWHSPRGRPEYWHTWSTGTTRFPLVDAGMRQLQATGYCSNRVRQNCASFLAKDLEIDWRAGADLFQFLLEDHCVGSNWGNWMYFSGVGSDPKSRHFRTISQALRYDPNGTYVSQWLDRLKNVTDMEAKFRPWDCIADWGIPVVDPATQLTWKDSQRFIEKGYLCEDAIPAANIK